MVGEGARNRDEDLQLEIMDKGELQVAMIKRVTSVDEMPAICKEENPSSGENDPDTGITATCACF
ncbi:unnamed protein product [Fusarium graminearum]|nr:unnamed protein product [Fusarium graminearum]